MVGVRTKRAACQLLNDPRKVTIAMVRCIELFVVYVTTYDNLRLILLTSLMECWST